MNILLISFFSISRTHDVRPQEKFTTMLPTQEAMDPKAVTRILQHSILQLCNEHVGYTNKLQILGVLCMTIDDEQHELVVKVNNTLKRVHPGPQKEGSQTAAPRQAPVVSGTTVTTMPPAPDQGVVNIEPLTDQQLNAGKPDRRHGRKGRPVKVEQVLDNPAGDSDDEIQGEDGILTVIPRAPSTSPTRSRTNTPIMNGIDSNSSGKGQKRTLGGATKRKTNFRTAHHDSSATPSPTPSQATSLDRTSPYIHTVDGVLALQINGDGSISNQPEDLSTNKNGNKTNGEVKDEPSDSYEYSNVRISQEGAPMNMTSEQTTTEIFSNFQKAYMGAAMEQQAATITYSGLGLLQCAPGSLTTPILAPAPLDEGLTIKYTNTGPYTVGANGRDVSNSSKIKDIIMYNENTPLSEQKGARIETEFMVDKLAHDGRKRRRRAAEDMMTPEEVSEYIGKVDSGVTESYQCKYCGDQVDSVLRYIQHTVLAHQAYICHQCGKSFTTKSSLLRHRPIHTGMRRFACSICKKTFYRKDKCKSHIKRHLGAGEGCNVEQFTSPFTSLQPVDELDLASIMSPPGSLGSSPAVTPKKKTKTTPSSLSSSTPILAQALSNLQQPTPLPSLPSLTPAHFPLLVQPLAPGLSATVPTTSTPTSAAAAPKPVPPMQAAPAATSPSTASEIPEASMDSDDDEPQSLVVDMGTSDIITMDSPERSTQLNTPPPLTIDLPNSVETTVA